jgi:hypothetical protein
MPMALILATLAIFIFIFISLIAVFDAAIFIASLDGPTLTRLAFIVSIIRFHP